MESIFNQLIAQLQNPKSTETKHAMQMLNTRNDSDIPTLINIRMQRQPPFFNSMEFATDTFEAIERAFAATVQWLDPNLWVNFVTQVREFIQNQQHIEQMQQQMQMQRQQQPYTMSLALAILNCHGGRPCRHKQEVDPINRINDVDVLTLNYLGSMFKVSEQMGNNVARSIFTTELFNKGYPFIGQDEYDSFPPIWKVVETISRKFKENVNQLIKAVRIFKFDPSASMLRHEKFRAMNDELVSCKLLPHMKTKRIGIFKQELKYDMPVSLERSFKIAKFLHEKNYVIMDDSKSKGHYIKFLKIRVTMDGNNVTFQTVEEVDCTPELNVVITKSEIINSLRSYCNECELMTLIDLTCGSCHDACDDESRLHELHLNTRRKDLPAEYSEPGEGGGKKSRSKKRGRKSIHRRKKSMHKKRK